MTIENLTEGERHDLAQKVFGMGPKALRIIDAQAVRIAELEVIRAENSSDNSSLRDLRTVANARIAELEALLKRCQNEAADTWGVLVSEANDRIAELEAQSHRLVGRIDELKAADYDALNARIAELEAQRASTQVLAHANARAEAAERERFVWASQAQEQRCRADAAEHRRGQALALCDERERMLKAAESEAAALRAKLDGKGVCDGKCPQAEALRAEVERLTAQSREGWAKAGWNAGGEELLKIQLAAANALLANTRMSPRDCVVRLRALVAEPKGGGK